MTKSAFFQIAPYRFVNIRNIKEIQLEGKTLVLLTIKNHPIHITNKKVINTILHYLKHNSL